MRASLILLLLLASAAFAQTRPGTDVGTGESASVLVYMENSSVAIYAIYDSTSGAIRGYALWNDSVGPVTVRMQFVAGDPIELTAQPGTRAGARVLERGYTIADGVDSNIARFQGWVDHPEVLTDRDRTFPLATSR